MSAGCSLQARGEGLRMFVLHRALVLAALISCIAAAPAPGDRFQSLVGTWDCFTTVGANARHEYKHADENTITMANTVKSADGEIGQLEETYTFDGTNWSLRNSRAFTGKGPAWTQDVWEIDGVQKGSTFDEDVRVIHAFLNDGSFVRTWQFRRPDNHWQPFSSEVCQRST